MSVNPLDYMPKAYKLINQRVDRNAPFFDDLAQECYITLHKASKTFSGEKTFAEYVHWKLYDTISKYFRDKLRMGKYRNDSKKYAVFLVESFDNFSLLDRRQHERSNLLLEINHYLSMVDAEEKELLTQHYLLDIQKKFIKVKSPKGGFYTSQSIARKINKALEKIRESIKENEY